MSVRPSRKPRRRPGWVRAAGWLLLLLGSLFVVTWRQTRGLALEQALRDQETRRAVAEAERVELARRIAQLQSRSRVVRTASERLGLHLPTDAEIVFVPVRAPAAAVSAGGDK